MDAEDIKAEIIKVFKKLGYNVNHQEITVDRQRA